MIKDSKNLSIITCYIKLCKCNSNIVIKYFYITKASFIKANKY